MKFQTAMLFSFLLLAGCQTEFAWNYASGEHAIMRYGAPLGIERSKIDEVTKKYDPHLGRNGGLSGRSILILQHWDQRLVQETLGEPLSRSRFHLTLWTWEERWEYDFGTVRFWSGHPSGVDFKELPNEPRPSYIGSGQIIQGP